MGDEGMFDTFVGCEEGAAGGQCGYYYGADALV
jgi:hypothetical protein